MNKKQELKIKRADSVKALLDDNADVVNETPGLPEAKVELAALIDEAKSLALQQTDKSTPVTKMKKELRLQLETETLNISLAVVAYAGNSGDNTLQLQVEKLKLTKSEVNVLRDVQLHTFASSVYEEAAKYADNLAPYVTASEVAAYKTTIDSFDASIPKPKNAQSKSKLTTENLEEAIDAIDAFLNGKIEELISPWQNKKSDFYKTFSNAMVVGSTRSSKSQKDNGGETSVNADAQ